jgi:hypothetical protein
MRRVLIGLLIGAVIGFGLSLATAPTVIHWWYTPPSSGSFSCEEPVRWALEKMLYFELGSGVFGAVVGFAFTLGRRPHKDTSAAKQNIPPSSNAKR